MAVVRYWLPVVIVFGIIFYFSSLSPDELPDLAFSFSDKVNHVLAYSALAFCLCRALSFKMRNLEPKIYLYRKQIFLSIFVATLYGVSDEFHQSFTPGRDVEGFDVLADFVGGILGSLFTIPYRNWVRQWEK